MKALVIGATGATGRPLVEILLNDKHYDSVVVFVRKSTGIDNPKLTEYVTDFSNIDEFKSAIKGDVFFNCMGTTIKDAGNKDVQYNIDVEIPLKFASIAKKNDVDTFVLVSAANADINSRFFYSRIKGELEKEIGKLNFRRFIIFRPGMLERPFSTRKAEIFMVNFISGLNDLGLLRKFRPLPTDILAKKLVKSVKEIKNGQTILKSDDIMKL